MVSSQKAVEFNRMANDLLSEAYNLGYFPVGIKFVKKGGSVFGLKKTQYKKTICRFLKVAALGEAFFLDENSISCPGGRKWMGFRSELTETYFYKYFLGEVEKVKSSPEIAEKFIDFLPQPPEIGLYEKILFSPLKNCSFKSDVVVIITAPRYVYQIIITAYLDEYHLVRTIPISAACHGSITIPLMTGELNTSMIDPMSRKIGRYKNGEVLLGIPAARFESLINNIKDTDYKQESLFTKAVRKFID